MALHGTWGRSGQTGQEDPEAVPARKGLHGFARLIDTLSIVRFRRDGDEDAARQAQERWELAAAAAGFGVVEWPVGGDHVTLDARAAALCGCAIEGPSVTVTREELRARVHAEDLVRVRAAFQRAGEGKRFAVRCRVRTPDGEERHLQIVALQHPAVARSPARVVGVLRDVSAEELQVQLAMQRDNALALAKARMEFLSRLSHELRTPLNAIVGFAELMTLDSGNALPAAQDERLRHVVGAAQQLRGLVDEMLDLAKIDAGAIAVSVRLVDAAAVVRSAITLVEPVATQYGVTLVNHLGEMPLQVFADPQRLQQVFVNLLTNGCKYNRRGGEVVVSSEWSPSGLVVRFADTGLGIAPQDLAELGRPFKRVGTQSTRVEGSGLGLYIVKLILERMRATLDVRSEPGLGSCFSVVLPIRPPGGA
jgi:signal transduction histidine kinase